MLGGTYPERATTVGESPSRGLESAAKALGYFAERVSTVTRQLESINCRLYGYSQPPGGEKIAGAVEKTPSLSELLVRLGAQIERLEMTAQMVENGPN